MGQLFRISPFLCYTLKEKTTLKLGFLEHLEIL